jgi:Domain of unknown function (DUF1844)
MSAESTRSFEEQNTALFAGLVMQQANAALMCLGKGKHPGTGEETIDLDSARYLIDQLEMLAVKTKGNLSSQEEAFLKQSLMTARLTFVETASAAKAAPPPPPASLNASSASGADPSAPAPSPSTEETGGRAKFVKKY